jgi:hypothetical protein
MLNREEGATPAQPSPDLNGILEMMFSQLLLVGFRLIREEANRQAARRAEWAQPPRRGAGRQRRVDPARARPQPPPPPPPPPRREIEAMRAAALLDVPLDATEDVIRAALRARLATSRLHPDHGGDGEAAKELIAAKNLLIERARTAPR